MKQSKSNIFLFYDVMKYIFLKTVHVAQMYYVLIFTVGVEPLVMACCALSIKQVKTINGTQYNMINEFPKSKKKETVLLGTRNLNKRLNCVGTYCFKRVDFFITQMISITRWRT